MTPSRALAILGWSKMQFARRVGRAEGTVRRWIDGTARMPPEIAAWLLDLAQYVEAHPLSGNRR